MTAAQKVAEMIRHLTREHAVRPVERRTYPWDGRRQGNEAYLADLYGQHEASHRAEGR